jgi:hypothetical protein
MIALLTVEAAISNPQVFKKEINIIINSFKAAKRKLNLYKFF